MLKPMKRAVHFDFHTMPGVDNICEEFDAEKFAEELSFADVGYINVFARCNIGFSYYPTKVGIAYPGLKKNMLGDTVRECHKRGIGVTGYINAGINHELSIRHPEWLRTEKDGRTYVFERGASFFRTMCYNNGYSEYLLNEVKEVLALGVDGVFLDSMQVRPCYCKNCEKDMREQGIDISDDKAVTEFAFSVREKLCRDVRNITPHDKRLFLNGVRQPHAVGIDSHYEIESLWSYDFFYAQAAYARPKWDSFVYMNGRFQEAWGDFGGYKGKVSVENDFCDAIMNGAIPMLGDHLHPIGRLEQDIYSDLSEIYKRVKEYEKWTDNTKYLSDIAILTNDPYLNDSHYGVARMLSELKYSYDILDTTDDFGAYKVLIIPDSIRFDSALADRVEKYLSNGGKVISSGFSGLWKDECSFALTDYSFDCFGEDTTDTSYFKLNEKIDGIADMYYSYYKSGINMRSRGLGVSLADAVDGYFPNHGFDGVHHYRYVAPKAKNGNSVVMIGEKENVAHISFPIFSDFHSLQPKIYKEIIRILLEKFFPEKRILSDSLPSTSRTSLLEGKDYTLFCLKVTYPEIRGNRGTVEEHAELPAGKKAAILGEYKTVLKLPDETVIPSEIKNGYTYITLPEIVGFEMFYLK